MRSSEAISSFSVCVSVIVGLRHSIPNTIMSTTGDIELQRRNKKYSVEGYEVGF